MKAITCHNYGSPDVLKYEEIEKPTAGDDDGPVYWRRPRH